MGSLKDLAAEILGSSLGSSGRSTPPSNGDLLNIEDRCPGCNGEDECRNNGMFFSIPLINKFHEPIREALREFDKDEISKLQ